MEYEGGGCLSRLIWFAFVVPVLWVVGKLTGDSNLGSPD